jgi:hypothetical protein
MKQERQQERPERLAYTVEQFMAATGYSRNRTYNAITSGALRTFRDGKRRMISATAAREFIEARERATAEAA